MSQSCPDTELGCSVVKAREEQDPACPSQRHVHGGSVAISNVVLGLPRSFRGGSTGSMVTCAKDPTKKSK